MATKKKATIPVLPEGFFDIIPDEQRFWHHIWRRANGLLADYSFSRIDVAPVEQVEAFTRPVATSDPELVRRLAVGKSHGMHFAFRAALAPSLMRAYLQHGMHALPHPVKLFANAPVLVPVERGHQMRWQLGVQTIGDTSEAVDAELLFLGCRIIEAMSLGSFTVRLNTIGDAAGRQSYLRALRDFFRTNTRKISAKVAAAAKEHPFHGLAALAAESAELAREAPQSVDYLSEEARAHFKHLLEFLDEGQVPYVIDHTLVTVDDYASHTVWEFVLDATTDEQGQAIAGQAVLRGGRMDRLSELLGGSRTPAAGWALDIDLIVARLKAKNVSIPEVGARPKVFLSQLGEAAKKRSLMLFEEIRKSGIEVRYSLSRDTIKGQLRIAARYGVRFALIFGQKEALEGTVIVREMDTGIQETIPLEKIIDELKKRLKAKA
ncbi:MAG: ATP phosphoribosyltransferase regulatory subunit [Candidatus Yanofskybacteria bacterium]|nr:ATP phosphoribosyltransferase regulatory subunit [Candidatus Yanofskybacteria bacterium]